MERLSYASGASAIPLLGETLGGNFDRIAATFPDNEAVVAVHQNLRLTYREMRDATDELARGLMALGVRHGDRVGIWSTNNVEWVIAQFATPKIGAILVNLNPAYRSSEASFVLQQSGVSVLLVQMSHKASNYAEIMREISGSLPELRTIVLIGDDELAAPLPNAMRWADLLAAARNVSPEALAERLAITQFDEAINVQYTSGTTGFPKGATLTHGNILNNGFFIGEGCRFVPTDRVCLPVPFYHCFGMVLGNIAIVTHGATIVIPNYSFDPVLTMQAVVKERCTALYGRADDVHRRTRAARFRNVRLRDVAHGHHGGIAMSRRDHETRADGNAHAGSHDLLRHDRNLARFDADVRRRSASPSGRVPSAACTRISRSRSSTKGRPHRSPSARPASSARAAIA